MTEGDERVQVSENTRVDIDLDLLNRLTKLKIINLGPSIKVFKDYATLDIFYSQNLKNG